jgi:hypothetical protein
MAVAMNPATPPETLAQLARRGEDDSIAALARANSSCPPRPWWKKIFGV